MARRFNAGKIQNCQSPAGTAEWVSCPRLHHIMMFSFGHSEHERIEVDVLRYERSPVGEYHDDNWLTIEIRVRAGGFHGMVSAAILTEDLVRFASQLRPLYDSLSGSAKFSTMEGQLSLHLVGDGKG